MVPLLLLVEDDPSLRRVAELLAKRSGLALETAESVAAANTWFERTTRSPDLMLLDVRLPDGDGLTFLKELQTKHTNFAPERSALLSQLGMPDVTARAIRGGIRYLFPKALFTHPQSWQQRINEILDEAPFVPLRNEQPRAELKNAFLRAWAHPLLREHGSPVLQSLLAQLLASNGIEAKLVTDVCHLREMVESLPPSTFLELRDQFQVTLRRLLGAQTAQQIFAGSLPPSIDS